MSRLLRRVCGMGLVAWASSGCTFIFNADSPTPPADTGAAADDAAPSGYAAASRADLRMKRWRQLSLDLEGGLELTRAEVCREAGNFDCTRLHTAQLGGTSIDHALYEPITWWTVTTGLTFERVVLQACHNRLDKDRSGESEPVVFVEMPLDSSTLTDAQADAQATALWRRLLARDPAAWELTEARALHASAVSAGGDNGDWGVMLCFALATSTEHLLY